MGPAGALVDENLVSGACTVPPCRELYSMRPNDSKVTRWPDAVSIGAEDASAFTGCCVCLTASPTNAAGGALPSGITATSEDDDAPAPITGSAERPAAPPADAAGKALPPGVGAASEDDDAPAGDADCPALPPTDAAGVAVRPATASTVEDDSAVRQWAIQPPCQPMRREEHDHHQVPQPPL